MGNPEMTDDQVLLIAERLSHALDLLKGELRETQQELEHYKALANHRLERLEADVQDHEQRLRQNTEGVTQFKHWSGLAAGGSSLVSILALIKAFFSG